METTDRIKALQWWDTLSKTAKKEYTSKHFLGWSYKYLHSADIREIWRKEKTNS